MTITELKGEANSFVHEHWWNGAGVVVVAFFLVTFIWKRPDNDFLLYAALIAVGAHSYVSACCYNRSRRDKHHRQELAVAYREKLQAEESYVPDRSLAGRPRIPALAVAQHERRSLAAAAH